MKYAILILVLAAAHARAGAPPVISAYASRGAMPLAADGNYLRGTRVETSTGAVFTLAQPATKHRNGAWRDARGNLWTSTMWGDHGGHYGQFGTQKMAADYCAGVGSRLPTFGQLAELKAALGDEGGEPDSPASEPNRNFAMVTLFPYGMSRYPEDGERNDGLYVWTSAPGVIANVPNGTTTNVPANPAALPLDPNHPGHWWEGSYYPHEFTSVCVSE